MLHLAIAVGLILGLGFGLLASATGSPLLMEVAAASAPLGTVFMNAIRMVVIPLVMAVMFSGVARVGDPRRLGRLGGLTLAFFWATLVPAILIGMGVMRLGLVFAPEVTVPEVAAQAAPELSGLVEFLVSLIPPNPFAAAAEGSLLPLIVFTALLAAAAGTLDQGARTRLIELADAVAAALTRLVYWILWAAPVGIFGLAAPVTAQMGWALLASLAVFIASVLVGLALFLTAVYFPLLWIVARVSPVRLIGGTFGCVAVAFSTTSTVAALPITIEEVEKKLGATRSVAALLLPLGASMHRPGSALFQGAAVVFLAHLYGVPIPAAAIGGALLATFLVSLTVTPVPSASIMTLAPALDTVGVPLGGLAILLGVDRIPDMFRTAVNILGQITTTVLVDRWVGGEAPESLTPPAGSPR